METNEPMNMSGFLQAERMTYFTVGHPTAEKLAAIFKTIAPHTRIKRVKTYHYSKKQYAVDIYIDNSDLPSKLTVYPDPGTNKEDTPK